VDRKRIGRVRAGPTLQAAFDPKSNSLNALRLVFASAVIVSHAHLIGAFGPEPAFGGSSLGGWAVAAFFVASGYLIAGSRVRSKVGSFARRRALRIFPGLWACLLVIVLVFVPLAAIKEEGTFPPDLHAVGSFLFLNATLLADGQYGIDGTLETVPYPGSWDGSLWSLPFEVGCYIAVALLLTGLARRHPKTAIATAFAASSVIHLADVWIAPMPGENLGVAFTLLTYFLAGSLLWAFADRVPASWRLALLAVGAIAVTGVFGQAYALGALPLAYLCMWLAVRLPLQRVGRVNDISYGVYIYAFPVQQILVLYGGANHGIVVYIALTVALTFPLAALSWKLVEQPAMRRRRTVPAHKPAAPARPAPHETPSLQLVASAPPPVRRTAPGG
jgi:peptidoglycan/LPS O-acetylase OafA/YrhL